MKELDPVRRASWLEWITRNSLRGVAPEQLREVMLRRGMSEPQAQELLREVTTHPIYLGARPVSWRVRNVEALLNVQLALLRQDPTRSAVDRLPFPARAVFHREYYAANRPVVLEGLIAGWPALEKWSPAYFRDVVGDMQVEIQTNRRPYPVYEVFLKGHSETVTIGQFVSMIEAAGTTNDFYLTANDRFLERSGAEALLNDFAPPSAYFTDDASGHQFLWFGPKGAVSPLHRDRLNVLMTQVYGCKRVTLAPSLALHLVYNYESFFSEVDCEAPDLERYPLFADVPLYEVELRPGDALFIPVGWWHHVRALEISINVSFTNFLFPNDFERFFDHQIQATK